MSLANSSQKQVYYKKYTSAAITPGAPRDITVDPGTSGGQVLRYATCQASKTRTTFSASEKRTSMQRHDYRLGGITVPVSIAGDLSPATYKDFVEAIIRGTWAVGTSKTQAVFTSFTFNSGAASCVVGASTWAAQAFMVGDVIRFTNLTVGGGLNNNINYQIVALSGVTATLNPAPVTATADTTGTVAVQGKKLVTPASAQVSRLFLLEEYFSDVDLSMLTEEIRFGRMQLNMPAEGIVGITLDGIGRELVRKNNAASPFFAAPTGVTTNNVLTTTSGQLSIAGVSQGILTSMSLDINCTPNAGKVAFSPYAPEIFLGRQMVQGSIGAYFQDDTIPSDFDNETEVEVAGLLGDASSPANFISFFMPRVKFTSMQFGDQTDQGIPLTANFVALEKDVATGYDGGSITFGDISA